MVDFKYRPSFPRGFHVYFPVFRPAQHDGVNIVCPAGKTDVRRGKVLFIGIRKMAFRNHGGGLPEHFPVPRIVNSFAVHRQPRSHLAQDMGVLLRGWYHRALARYLKAERRFYSPHPPDPAPRPTAFCSRSPPYNPRGFRHRSVILPQIRDNMIQLPSLHVFHRAAVHKGVKFSVDGHLFSHWTARL